MHITFPFLFSSATKPKQKKVLYCSLLTFRCTWWLPGFSELYGRDMNQCRVWQTVAVTERNSSSPPACGEVQQVLETMWGFLTIC